MPTLRSITESDLPELGELLDDVFRRNRGITDQNMLADFPLVFDPSNYSNCHVIVEDGRIVSHAAHWERALVVGEARLKVGVVVAVSTDPDYRQRGHAAALMRSLQESIHQEGYDLGLLWTGVPDFYRKLGWETVSPEGWLFDMGSAQLRETGCDAVRFIDGQYLDDIIALYKQEPVRFTRTRDESVALLSLPKIDIWTAVDNGSARAYLVYGGGVNKPGIIEYGGDATGIVGLLSHVLETEPQSRNRPFLAFHARPDIIEQLTASGARKHPLESSKGHGSEMIYVINPASVTSDVRERLFTWGLDQA